jgi:hypothetical protein
MSRGEFIPFRVEMLMGCPRAVSRPAAFTPGLVSQPLWDDEIDGQAKALPLNIDL